METIGRLLRRLRTESGLSQSRLAERAATSQGYVSQVERGEISIRFDQAEKLLAAMGYELTIEARPMPIAPIRRPSPTSRRSRPASA